MVKYFRILFSALLMTSGFGFASINQQKPSNQQETDPVPKFAWKSTGTYKLPLSHSTLSLPDGRYVLLGEEARQCTEFLGNGKNASTEAITTDTSDDCVYFDSFNQEGYVSLDDWEQIDSKQFLESMIEATEESNKERKIKNIPSIHVIRWIQEPILNKQTHTVYWATELIEDGNPKPFVNSTALRLAKDGYVRLVWVTDSDNYVPFGGELDIMINSHRFDSGFRYTDYSTGDKMASYGIAALVAATAGAKIAKTGGFLFLFKKIGGFLAVGIVSIFGLIKRKLTRKQKTAH